MKKIVLASASLRRKQLLEQIGLKFEIDPSNSDEVVYSGMDPNILAKSISLEKAKTVAGKYRNTVIIAADTFGIVDGKIIGKPQTEDEARSMLIEISGRSHIVITGFTILDTDSERALSRSVETIVHFRNLTADEIDSYIETGEPLDKACAYGIQGLGAVLVERIEGDYFNVMGLPLGALVESLKEFGIKVL